MPVDRSDAIIALAVVPALAISVAHLGLQRLRSRPPLEPNAVLVILSAYWLFYPARAVVLAVSPEAADYSVLRGSVSLEAVATLLIAAHCLSAGLVATYHGCAGRTQRALVGATQPAPNGSSARRVAILLTTVAASGLLLIIVAVGGLADAYALFAPHARGTAIAGLGSVGLSLWSLFSVPAAICLYGAACSQPRKSFARRAFLIAFVGLLAAMLLIFGSRLSATLVLLAILVVHHKLYRSIPWLRILAALPALLLVSEAVVGARSATSAAPPSLLLRTSNNISYSVLDVGVAVLSDHSGLQAEIRDPARLAQLPGNLIPRFLRTRTQDLSASRLDARVADHIGVFSQRTTTGYPPSTVAESFVDGGDLACLAAGGLLGTLAAALTWLLDRVAPRSFLATCWSGLVVALAFNLYKDGDLVTSVLSDLRLAAYLAAATLVAHWIPGKRV